MEAFRPPEIATADLAPLALDLAAWGTADPATLAWLDPPPAAAFAQARTLLRDLGATGGDGRITPHGRAMAALPLHPRLAHMVLAAGARGLGRLAVEAAALIEHGRAPTAPTDFRDRVAGLRAGDRDGTARAVADTVRQIERLCPIRGYGDAADAGTVLALAYPDRVAQRRGASGAYRLANGRGAALPAGDALAAAAWLAIAEVEDAGADGRIRSAAPIDFATVESLFAERIESVDMAAWDERQEAVAARRQARLGALVLADAPWTDAPPDAVAAALLDGIRRLGLHVLPWDGAAGDLRARVGFARRLEGAEAWPDWSDAALLASLEAWLAPRLGGCRRRADLATLGLAAILADALGCQRLRTLDRLAPTHLAVPSGSRLRIDYTDPDRPVLAVRLQEMFGADGTPRVGDGRVPVTLNLLSPAGRPLQATRDLAGFWAGSYEAVRRDMRGRYPRHPWPDDPARAAPTARAKPRKT
jgi:ATP-dependent helicase HrpB